MPRTEPLRRLDAVVAAHAANIREYANSPQAFTRRRKLDAVSLVRTMLNMGGGSLGKELYDAFPDAEDRMTVSAFEQSRAKVSTRLFEDVFHSYNVTAENIRTLDLAHPYRVYAVDGSSFSVPHSPDSEFAIDKSGWKAALKSKESGVPLRNLAMLHANALFDLINRTYEDCIVQRMPEADERTALVEMAKRVDNSNPFIIIADRGYAAFNVFENLNRIGNAYYLIRDKVAQTCEIRELPDKECDEDIVFRITTSNHTYTKLHKQDPYLHLINTQGKSHTDEYSENTHYTKWDFGQFCKVPVRIVKFRINDPETGREQWEVLVTNLDRFEFPVSRLKELYNMRWGIETSFRNLKYSIGASVFHAKRADFIRMELFARLTMFNAVSRHIALLDVPQADRKHPCAIEFKMACAIVKRHYGPNPGTDDPLVDMLSYVSPVRPGRKDARKIRYKPAIWFVYRVA